jgi:uncharacterized protein
MVVFGYFASALIGVSLGLIGGGGSILTVPVLVYLFSVEPVAATAYSLFIVGTTSLVGALPKYKDGVVDLHTAFIFGLPSIVAVYITRDQLVPLIPGKIHFFEAFSIDKGVLMLLLFAVLMIVAAVSMIRSTEKKEESTDTVRIYNYRLIVLEGMVVGVLTGLVGAGGGFLIIPALVFLSGLPMKKAVGTSLLIIAAKSLFGFLGDLRHQALDWPLLLSITAVAITGILIGNHLGRSINGENLKKSFGWFVLAMGVSILYRELSH